MHNVNGLVMCLGDINGHVGMHTDGFDSIHVEYDNGERNLEGRMLLEFCLEKELCVSSIWIKKEK